MGYMIVMKELKRKKINNEVQRVTARKADVYSALTTSQAFF